MSTATAGTAARRRWPRRRVLVALLIVSAALNLFFVAGAAWTRLAAPPARLGFEERYARIAAQLDLDPRQRQGFERYVAAMRGRSAKMHREIAPLIAGAWDEIASPQADQAQIMQRYDEASRKWRDFQHESTAQTLDFLALLSPEQRSRFVAIVKQQRAAHFRDHR